MKIIEHFIYNLFLKIFCCLLLLPSICSGENLKYTDKLDKAGLFHYQNGQYNKAVNFFQQSLEIYKKEGSDSNIALSLNNIGGMYYSLSQYNKAVENFEQALEIYNKNGLVEQVGRSLNNIGMVYHSWGQYDKSFSYFLQALAIGKKQGNKLLVATILNNIALVHKSWGQYDKASLYLQQVLEIHKKIGNDEESAKSLHNSAVMYNTLGQNDKAMDSFQQALNINRRIGNKAMIAVNLNGIGGLYSELGQYDKAIKYSQQALEIDRKINSKVAIAKDLNKIGSAFFFKKEYDNTIKYYQQAIEINKRINREAEVASGYKNIGATYHLLGQQNIAIQYYKKSIQLIEKIRLTSDFNTRRDYLASQIDLYHLLAIAYLKNEDFQGVLWSIEQSHARVLAERIVGINIAMNIPSLSQVQKGLEQEEAVLLFSNINKDNLILMLITSQEIIAKELAKNSFLKECKKQFKEPILTLMEKQRGILGSIKIKKQQLFKEGELEDDFDTAIHYYRTLLTNTGNLRDAQKIGKLLHTLLVDPVKMGLVNKTKITIIPDGILAFLPFETLISEKNTYLIQDYELRYIQGLTINKILHNRNHTTAHGNKKKPILAMGGAVYEQFKTKDELINSTRQLTLLQQETNQVTLEQRSARSAYNQLGFNKWKELPGTLKEVKKLSTIFEDGDIITGDKVTENIIKKYSNDGKLSTYKIIHFATHGLVVPEVPELSAIVLSQFQKEQNGEDGYLRMEEIADLNIAADFINLSACNTGLGKVYNGEGVVGLTQSFLIAGANGLSVSLWQVADESTSQLMAEFYKKVKNKNMDYKQALAEVKREFIRGDYGEKYKSPYYWAPFIYYGK